MSSLNVIPRQPMDSLSGAELCWPTNRVRGGEVSLRDETSVEISNVTALRYGSVDDFKIEDIGSIKRVDDNLGNPSLMIYESSKFKTEAADDNGWARLGDRTMRQVAVGGAGVWGLAKDNTLWFRAGTAGKTDSSVGENWTKVQVRQSKNRYIKY